MKLGQGSHKRTPWWTWVVMLVCGAVVLPGAALVFGQPTQDQNTNPLVSKPLVVKPSVTNLLEAEPQATKPLVKSPESKVDSRFRLASFEVADVLGKMRGSMNPERAGEAERQLVGALPGIYPGVNDKVRNPRKNSCEFLAGEQGEFGTVKLGDNEPTMKIRGNTLYVYGINETMKVVETRLADIRQHGLRNVVVEVRFLSNPESSSILKALKGAGIDWKVSQSGGSTSKVEKPVRSSVQQASHVEPIGQTLKAELSDVEALFLIQTAKGTTDSNIRQAPTITMYNGQEGVVNDVVKRPFITGSVPLGKTKDGTILSAPKITTVDDGMKIRLKPTIKPGGTIELESEVTITKVVDVQEFTFNGSPKDKGNNKQTQTIQLPVVAVDRLSATETLEDGKTLLLRSTGKPKGAGAKKAPGEFDDMIVMLTCRVIDAFPNQSANNIATELPTSIQLVERVSPIARVAKQEPQIDLVIRSTKNESDFEPVVRIFEVADTKIQIDTKVEIKTTTDGVEISGDNLNLVVPADRYSDRGEYSMASGEKGYIRIGNDGNSEFRFSGNAKMDQEGDVQMQADLIEMKIDDANGFFRLEGKARLQSAEFELSAESINANEDGCVLIGDATVLKIKKDGSRTEIRGNKLLMNTDSLEVEVKE